MRCKCDRSRFSNGQLGHVITGDLGLIVDDGLRMAFSKGTKFRETPFLDLGEIKKQVRADIDSIAGTWAGKNKIGKARFNKW